MRYPALSTPLEKRDGRREKREERRVHGKDKCSLPPYLSLLPYTLHASHALSSGYKVARYESESKLNGVGAKYDRTVKARASNLCPEKATGAAETHLAETFLCRSWQRRNVLPN